MDAAVHQLVLDRAGGRCEYCLLPESAFDFSFHVEHIRAKQHRGSDDPSNLCLACDRCNLYKGPNLTAIDPETDEITVLFHPRDHQWKDHFAIVGAKVIGCTPTGRATAQLLHMNEPRRVRLRRQLQSDIED